MFYISLEAQPHDEDSRKTSKGREGDHVDADDASSTLAVPAVAALAAVVAAAAVVAVAAAALVLGGRVPDDVVDAHGPVAAGRGGVLHEAHVGAVVERAAGAVDGDDLQGAEGAVGDAAALGDGQLVDAERAGVGRVPEVRRQGDVEVGRAVAQAGVDEDVGPVVVQLELERAAVEGPLGDVTLAVGDASAWIMLVSMRFAL
jgi:hypothetical protein